MSAQIAEAGSEQSLQVASQNDGFRFIVSSGGRLIDFLVIWPVIFCGFSFTLFFLIHPNSRDRVDGHYQIPTLSQTGRFVPESLFFTYGLHLEGFLLCLLFTFLYVYFKNKIAAIQTTLRAAATKQTDVEATSADNAEDDEHDQSQVANPYKTPKATVCEGLGYFCCCLCTPHDARRRNVKYLNFWNRTLLVLGFIAAILMTIVGTVTLDVQTTTHGTFAFFMFLAAILHMILYYYALSEVMGYTQWQLNLLRFCLFVCVPFNIAMGIMILIMFSLCTEDACTQTPVQMVVALEYTTAIALLLYIYSFREPVKDITLFTMQPQVELSSSVKTPRQVSEEISSPYTNSEEDSPDRIQDGADHSV